MKYKNTIVYFAIVLSLFFLGSALAIMCIRMPLLSALEIFFYRGVVFILLWGLMISVLLLLLRKMFFKDVFLIRDAFLLFVVFCSVNLLFFTHVPVTADRSISVFMLGYMADNSDKVFSEQDIEDYFIDCYVKDYGAFEKRFHEQLESGTIEEVSPGEYRITESGKKLMRMYEKVAVLYQIDDRLIHPGHEKSR